jgi:hypothetical protein
MIKSTRFILLSSLTLISVGTVAMVNYQPGLKERLFETYSSLIEEEIHAEEVAPKEELDLPEAAPLELSTEIELPEFSGNLVKDPYENHLNAAEYNGIGLIQDEDHLIRLINNSVLVEVSAGKGYQVDELTHSVPYMTLHSKKVLEELGRTFEAISKEGDFFTVSSVTRTIDQQKNLKKRNRNATDGNSSHSYGVSFDISYIRFNGTKGSNRKAQKNLEAILNHFQKEQKIFVIKERKQACYHVTVR